MFRAITRFFSGFPAGLVFLAVFIVLRAETASAEVNAAAAVSLAAEISRLEKIVSDGSAPLSGGAARAEAQERAEEQYNALLALARLHQLAGNSEARLSCLERALELFPSGGQALLEQGRLFISLGEYEKAVVSAASLLGKSGAEYLQQGRLLFAQIEAFRSGNIRPLADLMEEKMFPAAGAAINYTLWKISENDAWKTRLTQGFPRSPEAKIAAASSGSASVSPVGAVVPAPVPQWLLFPGRGGILSQEVPRSASSSLASVPEAAAQPVPAVLPSVPQTVAPPSTAQPVSAVSPSVPPPAASPPSVMLQTGLFSQEENARALVQRLRNAGFEPQIVRRAISGGNYWAVHVPAAGNVNAMIKKLKDSGFDSFPVK